jgi:hypothetical protein
METFYRICSLAVLLPIAMFYDKLDQVYPDLYTRETWIGLTAIIVLVPSFFTLLINGIEFLLDDGSWKNGIWTSLNLGAVGVSGYVFVQSDADYGNCFILALLLAFFIASTLGVILNDWMNDMFMSALYFVIVGPADQSGIKHIDRATKRKMRALKKQHRDESNQRIREELNIGW